MSIVYPRPLPGTCPYRQNPSGFLLPLSLCFASLVYPRSHPSSRRPNPIELPVLVLRFTCLVCLRPHARSRRRNPIGFALLLVFYLWVFSRRGYATAVVGVSFASVCSHWLISIEHPTSTIEAVHLLLHACTEAISVLLWVSVRYVSTHQITIAFVWIFFSFYVGNPTFLLSVLIVGCTGIHRHLDFVLVPWGIPLCCYNTVLYYSGYTLVYAGVL